MSKPAIEIEHLNVEEKLDLIETIWESLVSDPSAIPVSEAQKRILDERLAEIDAGDVETIPWEEVKARIQKEIL